MSSAFFGSVCHDFNNGISMKSIYGCCQTICQIHRVIYVGCFCLKSLWGCTTASSYEQGVINYRCSGINASSCQQELDEFKTLANLTQYVDVGEVSDQKLAKLAAFVSKSISSQSTSLGTGGASQPITF